MKQWTVNLSGMLGSWGVSIMAFIQHMHVIAGLSAMAGIALTLSQAWDTLQGAMLKREEVRSKRIQNDMDEIELNLKRNELRDKH